MSALRGASSSDYVIVLGLIALFLIAGLGAFGGSLGKLIDSRAECVETWQCTQGKPLAPPPAAVGTPPPAAEKSWLDNVLAIGGDFAKGFIVDGLGGALQSTWDLVTDPVGTVSNMVDGVAAIVQNPGAAWEQVKSEFSENPARFLGSLASGLVGGPAGGLGKLGKVAGYADKVADAGKGILPPVARRRDTSHEETAENGATCTGATCDREGENCFAAGTPVLTPEGERPIESIAPGDVVVARDPETGVTGLHRVVETFITPDHDVAELSLETNGKHERFVVTPGHPFYVEGRGFRQVAELVPGDVIATANGTARVERLVSLPEHLTVFNFEVESAHTYFVGQLGAWVHNRCAPQLVPGQNVLVPRSDGSISGGRVINFTPNGKAIVEVKTADGQTGTKVVDPADLIPRRRVGEQVLVPRTDGSMSVATVTRLDPDGRVVVSWTDPQGRPLTKSIDESNLKGIPSLPEAEAEVVDLIRGVNEGRGVNFCGGDRNCGGNSLATDALLGGAPASAVRHNRTDLPAISKYHGGRPFVPTRGPDDIRRIIAAAGPGARGIVAGRRNGKPGHLFNVVNWKGQVVFVDAQSGKVANLDDGFVEFTLLRTN